MRDDSRSEAIHQRAERGEIVRAATIVRLLPILPIALCGCATPVPPVVKQSLKCEIPASMLEHCAQPSQIDEGASYEQVIDIAIRDRENLRICAQRQESLAETAAICQKEVAKYNQEISDINASNTSKK